MGQHLSTTTVSLSDEPHDRAQLDSSALSSTTLTTSTPLHIPRPTTTTTANTNQSIPDSLLGELGSQLQYDKAMGQNSRFLKTIRARHRQGALVVKLFVKTDPTRSFNAFKKRLKAEREALLEGPNVLSYSSAFETERSAYLVRQWLASNLYDRISTRPFLSLIEKKWIAFQLLMALKFSHQRGVTHGDIKTENILCTSWSWILLTDFSASFKPTYLPLDDPSTFSYYFDTASRRTCYLAPERFYPADSDIARKKAMLGWGVSDGPVTTEMDVFSLGCVLAELWMEGTPPFTLSQLFKYREGGENAYSIEAFLNEIEDQGMRDLIQSMVSRDPKERKSCELYLQEAKSTVFPEVFYTFLHPFLAGLNHDSIESNTNTNATTTTNERTNGNATMGGNVQGLERTSETVTLKSDSDDKIDRIWNEWEMVMRYLEDDHPSRSTMSTSSDGRKSTEAVFPLLLHVPGLEAQPCIGGSKEDGSALILLSLLCANLRNCVRPSSVIRALDLLLALNRHLSDETKLDRLVPYLVACLVDDSANVRSASIKSLTQVLISVGIVNPANSSIYPEYILPNIRPLAADESVLVRSTLASCLSSIATRSRYVLDQTQALIDPSSSPREFNTTISSTNEEESYDSKLLELHSSIQELLNPLLSDPEPIVRRALLSDIGELCEFFGSQRANDSVLVHLVTYLNSRDWILRSDWNLAAKKIAKVVGLRSFEEFLLPLMTLSLADKEEFVTSQVLKSLTDLMSSGLILKSKKWELVGLITGFLCHPNIWIREGSASFLASTSEQLNETDKWCILYPTIKRLLRADIKEIKALSILDNAREPLSRPVFEAAVSWASRAGKSNFWSSSAGRNVAREKGAPRDVGVRTDEDHAQMEKMKQLGMKLPDDEVKLNLMREYISRLAVARQASKTLPDPFTLADGNTSGSATILQELGIIPETVFFNVVPDTGSSSNDHSRPGGIPRRFSIDPASSLNGTPRSISEIGMSDRQPRSRQVSSSTSGQVDDLRRKLALVSTADSPYAAGGSPRPSSLLKNQRTVSETSSVKTVESGSSTIARVHQNVVDVGRVGAALGQDLANAQGTFDVPSVRNGEEVSDFGAGATTLVGTGLESPFSGITSHRKRSAGSTQSPRFETTYSGSESGVKQLLERAYLETYREPIPELGPFIPVGIPRRKALRTAFPPRDRTPSRPEGTLIAHLVEHKAAITSIAVSPDQLFFVTGSHDGKVKIWDTIRLEKNVTSKSRQTFDQGGKITQVGVIENTRSVASASDNGTFWIHRVDVSLAGSMPKYGKVQMIRQRRCEGRGEYVTCFESYNTDTTANLLLATSASSIITVDLRSMRDLATWHNPTHLGPITSMCLDQKRVWLVVGTSSGHLSLWDLRFGLLLRSWSVSPEAHRVERVVVHPSKGKGKWIIVSVQDSTNFGSSGEDRDAASTTPSGTLQIAQVWDLERGLKVEEFRVAQPVASSTPPSAAVISRPPAERSLSNASASLFRAKEATLDPALAIEQLLEQAKIRRARTEQDDSPSKPLSFDQHNGSTPAALASPLPTVRALLAGIDYSVTLEGVSSSHSHPSGLARIADESSNKDIVSAKSNTAGGYLLTAGEDRKLRYWDLTKPSKSAIVSGQELEEEGTVYTWHSSTTRPSIYLESHPPSNQSRSGASGRVHRSTLIANHQQQLLRAHHDAITAVTLIDLPFRCVVTGDRSGIVKVFE